MLLNQLEEPHQLVLLDEPQALVLEYRRARVRHAHQSPSALVVHEAPLDALELHVLTRPGSEHEIDGLVGAEQNPRSARINVELSGVLIGEDLGGMIGDADVGVDGPLDEGHGGVIVTVGCGGGRRGKLGIEEGREVVKWEGGEVGPVEGVGVHVEDGFAVGGGRGGDHGSR